MKQLNTSLKDAERDRDNYRKQLAESNEKIEDLEEKT